MAGRTQHPVSTPTGASADLVPGTEPGPSGDRGVYAISVAAELTGIEPHMLRTWERAGLLAPGRSEGGTRRYSADDLDTARHINELATAGINLPGIARVLDLERQLHDAHREIDRLTKKPPHR
ncbi:MerR family transcriptional regulator [Flindersiella endophytica]